MKVLMKFFSRGYYPNRPSVGSKVGSFVLYFFFVLLYYSDSCKITRFNMFPLSIDMSL